MMMRKRKKLVALWLSFAMVISILPVSVFSMQEAKAAGYGISNPRTDNNGVSTWDCIYFGNYWQNDTNEDGEADQDDEKEPIKWRVLSINGNDAFLVADKNLDSQLYHTESVDVTWETCTLRTWLNNDFYNAAFSDAEQSAIKTTTVVNEDNPRTGIAGGNNTQDKVYLLSMQEVTNPLYGFASDYRDSETRGAKNTEYTKARAWTDDSGDSVGDGKWYLRSPGSYSIYATIVSYGGFMYLDGGSVDSDFYAIRPALHLNLSSDKWSKAGTVSASGGVPTQTATAKPATTQKPASTEKPKDNPTVTEKPKTTSVTAPGKVKKLKAKNNKKKSVTLSWKRVSGAKGYLLQYATNKKFKKKTSKLTTKTKFTVKKLKKKKTYWFRVCAYKLNGKKKVYGKWSSIVKIKIKK